LYDIKTDENGLALRDENGNTVKKSSPTTDDNISKYFMSFFSCARILLQNGIDIYKILTEYIKERGCRVFLSVRMNDVHYIDNPTINSSFALKDNGIHTIGGNRKLLDFSQMAVRNYFYEYIKELLENYTFDGLELDWLRCVNSLPPKHCSDFDILNDYTRKIRKLLDSYDKELSLAVRVLADEQENLDNGIDVCSWIGDGNADIVTIENFFIPTNFEMPISQWRDNIKKRNPNNNDYHLLCGSDWAVSCVKQYNIAMTPALVRGFANECLYNGADGIYLFNFFEEDDTSSFELVTDSCGKAYLKNCFLERMKAAKKPRELPRRYVHIGFSNTRYPITLESNASYEFVYQAKGQFDKCKIVVGCDGDNDFDVLINGVCIKDDLQKEEIFEGFEYVPSAKICKENIFIYAVSQAAPCVKSALLPLTCDEKAKIAIKNKSAQTINILWLELEFE